MSELLDDCLRVIEALNRCRVDYIVIGGVAVNMHGLVRGTEDLDIFIRPTEENVARLRAALHEVWDDPLISEIESADLCGDYPAVRYGPPSGDLYVDILTRLGDAFRYDDLQAQEIEIDGVKARVATPKTLVRMKRDTVRPMDHADAAALVREFGLDVEET